MTVHRWTSRLPCCPTRYRPSQACRSLTATGEAARGSLGSSQPRQGDDARRLTMDLAPVLDGAARSICRGIVPGGDDRMTATLTLPHPAVPATVAPPVLVDDHGEFEGCLTALASLTDPGDRALCLDMAAFWAARCAVLVPDLGACAEWADIARLCQAVAATERGYVLPGLAAWMGDPGWDELAAGEYDRATVLRALCAAVAPSVPAGAARVLERIAASEPVTVMKPCTCDRALLPPSGGSPPMRTAQRDAVRVWVLPAPREVPGRFGFPRGTMPGDR